MENLVAGDPPSEAQAERTDLSRLIHRCCAVLLFLVTALLAIGRAQTRSRRSQRDRNQLQSLRSLPFLKRSTSTRSSAGGKPMGTKIRMISFFL